MATPRREGSVIKRIGMFVVALVAGYAVMIVGLVLSQEGLFGGISYDTTPRPQLAISGLLSVTSAVAGGAVAALIFGAPFFPPVIAMCGLVVIDTSLLIATGRLEGPLWFDLSSSAALLAGIVFGAFLVQRRRHARAR